MVVNEELKLLRKCQKWLGEGPVGGGGGEVGDSGGCEPRI